MCAGVAWRRDKRNNKTPAIVVSFAVFNKNSKVFDSTRFRARQESANILLLSSIYSLHSANLMCYFEYPSLRSLQFMEAETCFLSLQFMWIEWCSLVAWNPLQIIRFEVWLIHQQAAAAAEWKFATTHSRARAHSTHSQPRPRIIDDNWLMNFVVLERGSFR